MWRIGEADASEVEGSSLVCKGAALQERVQCGYGGTICSGYYMPPMKRWCGIFRIHGKSHASAAPSFIDPH
jgi:hypothetical protein